MNDSRHQVIFLGDTAVGKTSIISQYIYNTSNPDHQPTIGVDFFAKNIDIPDSNPPRTVRMQIWDTAGQERFHAIIPSYIRSSTVVVLVFDITSLASFNSLSKWHQTVIDIADPKVSFIVVGNKVDLEDNREVTTEKAESYSSTIKAKYIETSARTPINIEDLFLLIAKCPILNDRLKEPELPNQNKNMNRLEPEKITISSEDSALNGNKSNNSGICGC